VREIASSQTLQLVTNVEAIHKKFGRNKYRTKLGFGLHFGWCARTRTQVARIHMGGTPPERWLSDAARWCSWIVWWCHLQVSRGPRRFAHED
jgi:hypothetical protein